jgi:hypothetical protein
MNRNAPCEDLQRPGASRLLRARDGIGDNASLWRAIPRRLAQSKESSP